MKKTNKKVRNKKSNMVFKIISILLLISAIISSSMNADVLGDYELMEQLIPVEGANGYEPVDYKVWVYAPAYISENEIHKIKLG